MQQKITLEKMEEAVDWGRGVSKDSFKKNYDVYPKEVLKTWEDMNSVIEEKTQYLLNPHVKGLAFSSTGFDTWTAREEIDPNTLGLDFIIKLVEAYEIVDILPELLTFGDLVLKEDVGDYGNSLYHGLFLPMWRNDKAPLIQLCCINGGNGDSIFRNHSNRKVDGVYHHWVENFNIHDMRNYQNVWVHGRKED